MCSWYHDRSDWVDLTLSAICYLAAEVGGKNVQCICALCVRVHTKTTDNAVMVFNLRFCITILV